MKIIADLHMHSKYSRATSPDMNIETMARWAKLKGINILATGDFTHPAWFKELKAKLQPDTKGLLEYNGVKFMLSAETSHIYTKNKKGRRVHVIILAPDFESAEKINKQLAARGNVLSDGRPIFGFDVKDLVKICLDVHKDCLIIPAHAWTPWFAVFGSNSGFDSIEECFEEEAKNIYALETGLSSDPAMNWRLSALDKYTLISNSDSHSPQKMGREANVFDCELNYTDIINILKTKNKKKFLYTIEFFPEEGKYHYDGHRLCSIRFSPAQTKQHKNKCPTCEKDLTVGVMNRVDALADRPEGFIPENAIPFKSMVPLIEIIAEAQGKRPAAKTVAQEYESAISCFGTEFEILLEANQKSIYDRLPERTAQGIMAVREGKLKIAPGYDGVYGTVKIFDEKPKKPKAKQLELF